MTNPVIRLRPIKLEDSEYLLNIRNTPEVRRQCFKNKIVVKGEHQEWMKMVLEDPDWSVYVVVVDQLPIGRAQVHRVSSSIAEISYALHPQHWGKGYGKEILDMVQQRVKELKCVVMAASVRATNTRSHRLLSKYGFKPIYTGKHHTRFNFVV